jgi:hypothetical protein
MMTLEPGGGGPRDPPIDSLTHCIHLEFVGEFDGVEQIFIG